jgi:hypothetical protein
MDRVGAAYLHRIDRSVRGQADLISDSDRDAVRL